MSNDKQAATLVQPAITGYRQLSHAEADLMNEIKAFGVQAGALVERLRAFGYEPGPEGSPPAPVLDQRWVSIGATDLQTGLMALTRAVARPTTF